MSRPHPTHRFIEGWGAGAGAGIGAGAGDACSTAANLPQYGQYLRPAGMSFPHALHFSDPEGAGAEAGGASWTEAGAGIGAGAGGGTGAGAEGVYGLGRAQYGQNFRPSGISFPHPTHFNELGCGADAGATGCATGAGGDAYCAGAAGSTGADPGVGLPQ
jgi:hypothetical protein